MCKELTESTEKLVFLHQSKNKLLETITEQNKIIKDLRNQLKELPKKICDEIKKVAINHDEVEWEYDYWVTQYYILEDDIDEIQAKYEKEIDKWE